jgi:integrase
MRGLGRTFKRGSVWWIAYYYRGAERRESSQSENEGQAKKLLKKRLGEMGRGNLIGPVEEKVSFEDLAEDLVKDYEVHKKRSLSSIKLSRSHLRKFFGFDKALDITTDRITTYVSNRQGEIRQRLLENAKRKRQEAARLRKTVNINSDQRADIAERTKQLEVEAERLEQSESGNASINRELAALKRMFTLAVQARKLSSKPYIPTLEENNARQGFLDHAGFLALRDALPEYLRDPITFLYLSGWRVSEMRCLEWRDVDLVGKIVRLRPEISKNKDGRLLPLNAELESVFERGRQLRRIDCPFVFHSAGRKIGDFKKAWKTACRKQSLGGTLIHDLRRTAVRNMVRAGVPERVAMALSGHKTRNIFDRYNIVSEADLLEASQRLESHLRNQPKTAVVVSLNARSAG